MRFRYILTEETKGSYLLPTDPVGWEELETSVIRGLEYHGFFYEQTASLKFYCGNGREWIEEVYEELGIEAVINISIGISCDCGEEQPSAYSIDYSDDYANETIQDCNYETFYDGVLDLQSLQFTDEYLEVSIINDSFFTKIRNNLDTKVNVNDSNALNDNTIDVVSPIIMNLHSKTIVYNSKWLNCNDLSLNIAIGGTESIVSFTSSIPFVPVIEDSGFENNSCGQDFIKTDSTNKGTLSSFYFLDSTNFDTNVSIEMSGTFQVQLLNGGGANVTTAINLYTSPLFDLYVPQLEKTLLFGSVNNVPAAGGTFILNYDIDTDFVIDLTQGRKAYIIVEVTGIDRFLPTEPVIVLSTLTQTDGSNITTNFASQTLDTTASVYQIHDISKQVTRAITGENEAFRSELLGLTSQGYTENGTASWNVITSGNLIRNIDKPLNTTMRNIYKSVDALYNAGLGIEKYNDEYIVRIENKEYFYDKNSIITFDWVADITKTIAKELYYNRLVVGFDAWEIEEASGLDEFNTKREYNTRIDKTENNITSLSPFIGSGYAIEFTRRQTGSNDWKYDNDNFIIASSIGDLTTAEKDENFSSISNVIDAPSLYNLRLSPTRALTRWMNVIGSSVYKYANRIIKYTYGEGNVDLQATETTNTIGDYNNQPLSEKQDIQWDGNAYIEPIWIPEYYTFDYPITFEQFKLIRDNAKQCIEFSTTDTDHVKGFIIECRYMPIKGLATFKLLKAWQ
jgi:hypothetical protein